MDASGGEGVGRSLHGRPPRLTFATPKEDPPPLHPPAPPRLPKRRAAAATAAAAAMGTG